MKPHITPRVVLKQFRKDTQENAPVIVLNKVEMTYRDRGVDHNTFTANANYYGDGSPGTLEYQLAQLDEASISGAIDNIRNGIINDQLKNDFHFLLWNNTARNPKFRKHPNVKDIPQLTSEKFHAAAMDSIPDEYITNFEIFPLHIKGSSIQLILPDFSISHLVLAPDVVIIRIRPKDVETIAKGMEICPDDFVRFINDSSFKYASHWLASATECEFTRLGASKHSQRN